MNSIEHSICPILMSQDVPIPSNWWDNVEGDISCPYVNCERCQRLIELMSDQDFTPFELSQFYMVGGLRYGCCKSCQSELPDPRIAPNLEVTASPVPRNVPMQVLPVEQSPYGDTETWEQLYNLAMRNAASHRATGARLAKDRRGASAPLPSYVTGDVAHAAFADKWIRLAEDQTGEWEPEPEMSRRLIGACTFAQLDACARPEIAVAGSEAGFRHRQRYGANEGVDAAAEIGRLADPGASLELAEELARVTASLSSIDRETLGVVLGLEGCTKPWNISKAGWNTRLNRMRQAFFEAWHA